MKFKTWKLSRVSLWSKKRSLLIFKKIITASGFVRTMVTGNDCDYKYFSHLCFSTHLSVQYVGHFRATSHNREPLPPRVSKFNSFAGSRHL